MGYHDTAQVCLNGHAVNDSVHRSPEFNKKHCRTCGEATITNCRSCNAPIQGEYHVEGVAVFGFSYIPPSFCHNCGNPYPWTQSKILAAQELTNELEVLNFEEKEIMCKAIEGIVKDSPVAAVAAVRFKKMLSKIGIPVENAFRDILDDAITSSAKKIIWENE